ncbi:HAMP domain-containing histidine kinase [Microcoleus sp. LEGE 07076]|uniref:sensor histidine kinase n=1 Tax=Microcoleus sp. LEGE 07076 TaxID=915322 RepID=UPI0018806BD6|nr:HAMP domain-containing sensor histidine kinase [Microcoleus sp. LEGE 07076]MBE9183477.1 HAMP domain-containing histidine kinase [Microcoleus sp. LEGE 07076]
MNTYFLPTISEILASSGPENDLSLDPRLHRENGRPKCPAMRAAPRLKAEQEWYGAIAALNQMLDREKHCLSPIPNSCQGLVLSGPSSVLTEPAVAGGFANWIFTSIPDSDAALWSFHARQTLALLPAADRQISVPAAAPALALASGDPLANEQFCLVLTATFSLVMALGENSAGIPAFLFSFDPQIVAKAWEVLRRRVTESDSLLANTDGDINLPASQLTANNSTKLDALFQQFLPVAPNYQTVAQFARLLLHNLPVGKDEVARVKTEKIDDSLKERQNINCKSHLPHVTKEVELLQAIAHEVRTPLATIRTLTRLLLKRPKLDPVVVKRLKTIDAECTAQIDRFGLIFRAVEMEMSQAKNSALHLTAMSLGEVIQNSIPRWQNAARQRNHTLEVIVPKKLPAVVSDPTMLDQVLTNLIENYTRTLPSGSHIQVEVTLAGDQLKLQLESEHLSDPEGESTFAANTNTPLRSIGPLLMVQPETGSLSLNLSVTKNLFRAAGGRLVIRQRPEKGEVMTVFLPLQ